jgi:hypothetical protein
MTTSSPIFKIAPGIQDYAWGKKGGSSLAAQFADVSVKDFKIKDDKTYAEVHIPFSSLLQSLLIHLTVLASRLLARRDADQVVIAAMDGNPPKPPFNPTLNLSNPLLTPRVKPLTYR